MSDSVRESIEPMHSEMIPQHDSVEKLGTLLQNMMGDAVSHKMSANQRALVAWHGANGDRERAHTTRVYLKESSSAGAAPIICVMVDSHPLVSDFMANRDLYLARLANQGFSVSGIEFMVDRSAKKAAKRASREKLVAPSPSRTLTKEEQERIESLVAGLEEPLRSSVSKAIENSYLND